MKKVAIVNTRMEVNEQGKLIEVVSFNINFNPKTQMLRTIKNPITGVPELFAITKKK